MKKQEKEKINKKTKNNIISNFVYYFNNRYSC